MEHHEIVVFNRDKNSQLLPIIIKRLWNLYNELMCQLESKKSSQESVQNDSSEEVSNKYSTGCFNMYPVDTCTQIIYILRYLRPLGEYTDYLKIIVHGDLLELALKLADTITINNGRVSFDAMMVLGSLMYHKKLCFEFIQKVSGNSYNTCQW